MASLFLREGTNKSPQTAKIIPSSLGKEGDSRFGKKKHAPSVVDLKPGATPVRQKQYPVPWEACLGIQDNIQWLQDAKILIKCQSPWNTPLLAIKKSGGNDYRPSQDFHAVNSAVITIHPMVPNPYILLSLLPTQVIWFTCLNLKDAFFCFRLSSTSQPLFALEWEDTGRKTQLTWTRLPQDFKNSPTLFSEALAVGLAPFPRETKLHPTPVRE